MSEQNGTGNTLADIAKGDIDKVKQKLDEKPDTTSLHMSRVPTPVEQEFKDLAKYEFADDYGMALTFLLRSWKQNNRFQNQLNTALDRMMEVEEKVDVLHDTLDADNNDNGKVNRLNE
jgi:hypothetical protein